MRKLEIAVSVKQDGNEFAAGEKIASALVSIPDDTTDDELAGVAAAAIYSVNGSVIVISEQLAKLERRFAVAAADATIRSARRTGSLVEIQDEPNVEGPAETVEQTVERELDPAAVH